MNSLFAALLCVLLAASAFSLPHETTQIRVRRQMGMMSPAYGSFQPYGVVAYPRVVPAYAPVAPVAYGPSLYSPMALNSGFNPGYGSSFGYPQMSNPSFMMGYRNRARH